MTVAVTRIPGTGRIEACDTHDPPDRAWDTRSIPLHPACGMMARCLRAPFHNQNPKTMKLPSTISIACMSAILLLACGRNPGETTEKVDERMQEARRDIAEADDTREWMKERDNAVTELNNLRDRLIGRRARIETRLSTGVSNPQKRTELQNQVTELNTNIARIEAELPRLDRATDRDWDRLRDETRNMRDTTSNWFDRQLEKFD